LNRLCSKKINQLLHCKKKQPPILHKVTSIFPSKLSTSSLQKIISTQQYVCNPLYQQNSEGVWAAPRTDGLRVITHAQTLAQHKRTRGNVARVLSSVIEISTPASPLPK
jgi:hypothetical protein